MTLSSLPSFHIPDRRRPAAPIPTAGRPTLRTAWRAMRNNPITAFSALAYEEPFLRLTRGLRGLAIVNDPAAIERVLVDNAANYRKGTQQQRRLQPALGQGLLTADGEAWKLGRRIAAPLFSPRSIVGLLDEMREATEAMAARWHAAATEGRPLDLAEEYQRLTYDIVSRTVFSGALDADRIRVRERMAVYFDTIGRIDLVSFLNLPGWLPTVARFRARPSIAVFREVVGRAVESRSIARARGEPSPGDLLDRLIDARDPETGEAMPLDRVYDEVLTFLAAGHETTGNSLAWISYLLASFPWADESLAAEISNPRPRRDVGDLDFGGFEFTRSVIDEAMRLYPPAPFLGREAIEDDDLCGEPIGRGTQILISPWLVHRHRRLWHEPDLFSPERFSGERRKAIRRGAFIPFGLGPRICIGQSFALQEILTVLSTIIPRYRFELSPDFEVAPQSRITLFPRDGLRMFIRPR